MVDTSMATSSTSPSHGEKRHWWLSTKKMVDKYVRDARVMISTQEQSEIASALSLIDAALTLSPRYELALELKARCLLHLHRYKEVADMLQDYIPSYKMAYSDDSSESSSDNSSQPLSRERVKLLGSSSSSSNNNSEESNSPSCDYPSFKCFSVSDLKKKVLSGLYKNCDKEGQWRYLVLGQACCHLGLMEDALVLLQHGKRLASAAFRRESICWSDDSFSFPLSTTIAATDSTASHQPLTESESISHLVAHIKLLLRRRAAALAALDAGLYSESIRHFSKILDGRRPAPQAFLAECYLHRSAAFNSAGRIAESIADLNRALALDPNSTGALQARADLFELIGCITDAVHDLEHVKLIYNSILRDRKPPSPAWKPRSVSYKEIPGRLCTLGSKIQQLKQKIAMGETGNVDYYALIGVRRGCSRSELDRAHLILVLKHKPDKSIGFIDRCEFADDKDFDSVKDRARMSAVLLYRLIQKGYSSVSAAVAIEEAAEKERKKAAVALQQAQTLHQLEMKKQAVQAHEPVSESKPDNNGQLQKGYSSVSAANAAHEVAEKERKNAAIVLQQAQTLHQLEMKKQMVRAYEPVLESQPEKGLPDDRTEPGSNNRTGSFPYQGVFCRDLAVVGTLLSQAGFNRPLAVKYEALSC